MSLGIAIFLCDITGVMAKPWIENGYDVILVDPQHPEGVTVEYVDPEWSSQSITKVGYIIDHPETWCVLRKVIQTGNVVFVAGFPPCTDLAVSGARWFEAKRQADPAVQFKAMHVVWQCQVIGELSGAPWFAENPVSQISSLWRKPDHSFHPWQFTGFVIDDCYWKKTCLWSGGGFAMPAPHVDEKVASCMAEVKKRINSLPMAISLKDYLETFADISDVIREFYPSDRIHKCPPGPDRANIRSATPEGFARAVFLSNAPCQKAANDNRKVDGDAHLQIGLDGFGGDV